jgi:hypothetical protein
MVEHPPVAMTLAMTIGSRIGLAFFGIVVPLLLIIFPAPRDRIRRARQRPTSRRSPLRCGGGGQALVRDKVAALTDGERNSIRNALLELEHV